MKKLLFAIVMFMMPLASFASPAELPGTPWFMLNVGGGIYQLFVPNVDVPSSDSILGSQSFLGMFIRGSDNCGNPRFIVEMTKYYARPDSSYETHGTIRIRVGNNPVITRIVEFKYSQEHNSAFIPLNLTLKQRENVLTEMTQSNFVEVRFSDSHGGSGRALYEVAQAKKAFREGRGICEELNKSN